MSPADMEESATEDTPVVGYPRWPIPKRRSFLIVAARLLGAVVLGACGLYVILAAIAGVKTMNRRIFNAFAGAITLCIARDLVRRTRGQVR